MLTQPTKLTIVFELDWCLHWLWYRVESDSFRPHERAARQEEAHHGLTIQRTDVQCQEWRVERVSDAERLDHQELQQYGLVYWSDTGNCVRTTLGNFHHYSNNHILLWSVQFEICGKIMKSSRTLIIFRGTTSHGKDVLKNNVYNLFRNCNSWNVHSSTWLLAAPD